MDNDSENCLTATAWNCVTGCTKLSPGCQNCTCEQIWPRLSGNEKTHYFGRKFSDVMLHADELSLPARKFKPRMFQVNPMSDTFHSSIPDSFLDKLFAVMFLASQHNYQILTKRIDRATAYLTDESRPEKVMLAARALFESNDDFNGHTFSGSIQWPLSNVWMGVSVENQSMADDRICKLINTPAAVRFVSVVPMIGKVSLTGVAQPNGQKKNVLSGTNKIDWVIVGCESGPARRKLDIDWVRSIRAECRAHATPFYLKQLFMGFKVQPEPALDGRKSIEFPVRYTRIPQNNVLTF